MLHPPASTQADPILFDLVGSDIFEFEHLGKKHKMILWRDRASGYVVTQHLQEYEGHWEPTAKDVINSFTQWLMTNPSPTWLITDAGVQYTSDEFITFCQSSGIGLLTAPAEAHWILGAEESTIGISKASVARLLKEEPSLTVPNAFALAAHGCNHTIGPSGFSAFQWVRGGATPQDPLLSGLEPRKAFGGLLRLKEKARIEFEQEHAKQKLSKLGNALGRSPASFKPGSLIMIWRQRVRPGKTSGNWYGPVRVLLQEGSTLWLGSGATLIRAKTNQCRECTTREQLQASLNGVAVLQQPVTLETLLKTFTGRHFQNIAGEAPSQQQMADDLSATDVRVAPDLQRQPPDERRVRRMSDPTGQAASKGKSKGKTQQKSKPAPDASAPASASSVPAPLTSPVPATPGVSAEVEGQMIPGTPNRGTPRPTTTGSGSNKCMVNEGVLPGGHAGPHKDGQGQTFSWTASSGRIDLDGDQSGAESDSSSSTSSSSSEELRPDPQVPMDTSEPRKRKEPQTGFYALEIDVDEATADYLRAHPRKAAIWLSKRMQEKGKEHHWQHLPLERKKDFDLAQAKELSNVLQSKALRGLSRDETMQLNPKKCMQMRWVLTTKPNGDAKARLVILGYQAHNLTEVQAAAPTMSRMSRCMMLAICANLGLSIRSGDVTSAFLQTNQSMEDEDLVVWATPELAVLFGASPEHPWLP